MSYEGLDFDAVSGSADWKTVSKKAIYTTGIASVGAYLLFGEKGTGSFFNVPMPAAVSAGVGAGVGSVASDLLSGYVVNQLDQSESIRNAESTAIKLGVAGLGTALALQYGTGTPISANTVALGAGSKFAGDAVHSQIDSLKMFY